MTGTRARAGLTLPEFRRLLATAREQHPGDAAVRSRHAPSEYRTVGILGGGTAGYLAALALRKFRPEIEVSLIASSKIPVIGVGESTTSEMPPFLHRLLGLEIREFYRVVKPTWKYGIRFEWGASPPYYFNYPFDDGRPLEAETYDGDTRNVTLLSVLMSGNKGLVARLADGVHVALLGAQPFAYHLDNRRLVAYLEAEAARRGVRHLDVEIVDAELSENGEEITALMTDAGERLAFDLYIDCSGFRASLIEGKLGSPFISFRSSLFTDRAVIAEVPHGGLIKPYTTARTMDHGWCWNIPQVEEDHLGYVHASAFCSEDEAFAELRALYPDARDYRVVKFRSGRHEHFFKGNVVAIGNAYGFVEPLEATALQVIISEICLLMRNFPTYKRETGTRKLLNDEVASLWDYIRWFLSIHYRFNGRLDTAFWRECRAKVDISGAADTVRLFQENAPLVYRDLGVGAGRHLSGRVFNSFGFDVLLYGQRVSCQSQPPRESRRDYRRRVGAYESLAAAMLPQAEGLDLVVSKQPEALTQLVADDSGWLARYAEAMY
ncbi:MAG: tryptophan 7-halogenase [Alphaproteobacteria bacterium]|nr:tryptophan 7-halogenase [Alphaproteobacteria bacterium]